MDKTIEHLKQENEELRNQLKEATSIIKIIRYAWQRSNWQFPRTVPGDRMSKAVFEGERLVGTEN